MCAANPGHCCRHQVKLIHQAVGHICVAGVAPAHRAYSQRNLPAGHPPRAPAAVDKLQQQQQQCMTDLAAGRSPREQGLNKHALCSHEPDACVGERAAAAAVATGPAAAGSGSPPWAQQQQQSGSRQPRTLYLPAHSSWLQRQSARGWCPCRKAGGRTHATPSEVCGQVTSSRSRQVTA